MAVRSRLIRLAGGRGTVVLLGTLYVAAAWLWVLFEFQQGAAVIDVIVDFTFILGSGCVLLITGIHLPASEISPRYYSTVAAAALIGIGIMLGLIGIYEVQPGAGLSNPIENVLILTGLSSVAGLGAGIYNARESTRALELRRALDLLQRTERTARVGGWELDAETGSVFWSENLFDLLRYEDETAPDPAAALSLFHDDDQSVVRDAVESALETGEPFDIVVRFRTPDGETRWLRLQGNPEMIEGDVVAVRGAAQDITERKEMERSLRESEATFRMIAQNLDEVVWLATPDLEEFIYTNPTFEDVFGIERSTLYEAPDSIVEIIHPDDREAALAAFERLPEEPCDEEFRIHRDGEVRWIHARGHLVEETGIDADRVIGVGQDVTERKERERMLDRQASHQEAVAALGQLALETDDLDALMRAAANDLASEIDGAYAKVLELEADDDDELWLREGVGWPDGIVGSATVSAVADDSQAAFTLDTAGPVVVTDLEAESRFSGPDLLTDHGVRSGISTTIGPETAPWGILAVHDTEPRTFSAEDVAFVQTVSHVLADAIQRRRYQRDLEALVADLEESNERLEQFAYAASHDLQEPLRMVSSYLQLIERRYGDGLDNDAIEFLGYAIDGANRMRRMIDGLLQYSRIETEGNPLEPVDLDDVLEDVRRDLDVPISEHDARIEVEALPTVRGDAAQLEQLFQNLLRNAIEYRGDAPPEIRVWAERQGEYWQVHVEDAGVGIDPDQQDRIFEIFQRLDAGGNPSGSGIGLALCQRIVERHGGEIRVESMPGEGATFSFTLPAHEPGSTS